MKVKNAIRKVGAVAASTLMVGMTMGAAQSLSEFPGMFVDDDGTPTAQVVVGSQGAVSDVVGAVNVAAALGQATIQTSEQTETVDVETEGSVGWSASDGTTLDTGNTDLHLLDAIDEARSTLTGDHLDALQSVTFTDEDGNNQDVDHYLYLNNREINFGQPGDTGDQDPFLYVKNPADVDGAADLEAGLYYLQANFEDGLDITDEDNDPVLGEEIELFGSTFTISEDSFQDDPELILYGSSEEYDLESGESTEFEVNGETHTLEVRAITGSSGDQVAFYLDGSLMERTEGNTFNVDGTDVRVQDVIQTSSQDSEGLVTFSIGSEEYVLQDGEAVEDEDGDDIEGTYVEFEGDDETSTVGNAADNTVTIDSINVGVGSEDSDDSFVAAGETFEDPLFSGVNFHFGGLAPDAGDEEYAAEIGFTTDNEVASVDFSDGDGTTSVEFFNTNGKTVLQNEDNEEIVVTEGQEVEEDEHFVADPGDFDRLWEVRDISSDGDPTTSGNEASVTLRDVVTGNDVEVELDEDANYDSTDYYVGDEVIDGQTYNFRVNQAGDKVWATWGTSADTSTGMVDVGEDLTVYPALDTAGDAAVSFLQDDTVDTADVTGSATGFNYNQTVKLPSTETTGDMAVEVAVLDDYDSGTDGPYDLYVDGEEVATDIGSSAGTHTFSTGALEYKVTADAGTATDTTFDLNVRDGAGDVTDASVGVIKPEDDDSNENAYVVTPGDEDDGTDSNALMDSSSFVYHTGDDSGLYTMEDTDDNVEAWYDDYGVHAMLDTDDEGELTLHVPGQQSVAGAAVTGTAGELSESGTSTGSGEVTYTGVANEDLRGALPDLAKTDDQVTQSDRQNSHLILVGGPAVNTLVADLADEGETWTTDEWRNEHVDEALLQVVEDAFNDGQHAMIVAGHSADDTRAAARYISEYASHQDTLADAGMQYSPSSQEAPR